jgi:hypothetical protein
LRQNFALKAGVKYYSGKLKSFTFILDFQNSADNVSPAIGLRRSYKFKNLLVKNQCGDVTLKTALGHV